MDREKCKYCEFYSKYMLACMNDANEGMRVFNWEQKACEHFKEVKSLHRLDYFRNEGVPRDFVVEDCLNHAKENDVWVKLEWDGPDTRYYGNLHHIIIKPTDTLEECLDRMPKMYGL